MDPKNNNIEFLSSKYVGYAYMYTQYPNQGVWSHDFEDDDFKKSLNMLPDYNPDSPLMLYVHFPYCPTLCTYCTCFKIIKDNYTHVDDHFPYLLKNIQLLINYFKDNSIAPNFKQVHLGGGSPSYLNDNDFSKLVEAINDLVKIEDLDEFNLEIDPRQVDAKRMKNYSRLGINRISFGVQDFEPEVMQAVNRVQPAQLMRDLLTPEIRKLFPSIHFDFLLGLPKQTIKSFRKTLDVILELAPDRLVLSTYRHEPNIFVHQKNLINENDLPSRTELSEIFLECVERLLANGYKRIGLEYFAKPEDGLAQMYDDESCNWNMIGYSRGNGNKIVGVGLGATSRITDTYYFENVKTLEEYKNSINLGQFPVNRGWKLTRDDMIRREVTVNCLRSKLYIDYKYIEDLFEIDFKKYFAKELSSLDEFVEDGLIILNDNGMRFTDVGKMYSAFVCMVFDAYYENN